MSDQLKQFIEKNRNEFDNEVPQDDLFKRIRREMNVQGYKKKSRWKPWAWAAAFTGVILLSASYFILSGRNSDEEAGRVKNGATPSETNFIGDMTYASQINEFRQVIGLKQSELKLLEKEYPDLYKKFREGLIELDSSYQSLKTKLAENPNRELLLEAMLQNLQLQSELLNRQLLIIKEIKQKSNSYEKSIS